MALGLRLGVAGIRVFCVIGGGFCNWGRGALI
jgi:hypothetical protein